ncbi:hypothetical protein TRFO_37222 [Tritrichomonas foetus]|uniref:FMP27/BLTP2/Hobbit GFWDK motif-containing RBG unit domain-containing protein n=1 Tax=Tritrichomonas foetus TaxID=1144522 RepID=A0A1J4JGK7_9EUKA|nr:hypothetical protein TRFO_37222 [Tritrichomonas foetus]|eukprot:OHS96589.1 hypothetical protein TRFO_37222 [Tritrichomonas foetus]
MILICFLIALILLVILYIFVLRKLPLKFIARAINAQIKVREQNGLFSFKSLNLESKEFSLSVDNSKISVNPIGLFSEKRKLLIISISKIAVKIMEIGKHENEYDEINNTAEAKEKIEEIKSQLFKNKLIAQIAFYCARFFDIKIQSIELEKENLRISSSFSFHYQRRNDVELALDVGETILSYEPQKNIKLDKFGLAVSFDLEIIYNFLFNAKLFIANFDIKSFCLSTTQNSVTLHEGEYDISFCPGFLKIKHTSATISEIPLTLPRLAATITNLNVSIQTPTVNIPYIQIQQAGIHLEEFNVKIVSEHFLRLSEFDASIKDFKNFSFDAHLNSLLFHYSSLDGCEIFPLVKQVRNPVWKPIRPRLAFPDGKLDIKSFKVKLVMTNEARIRAISSDIQYLHKSFNFPFVQLFGNKHPLAKVHNFSISSPDEIFLTFAAESVIAHDHHKVQIGWFIRNILYGWHIIKPWASGQHYDSETIPLPIHIVLKNVCLKIDDTPINRKLITLSKSIPQYLKEKACMRYIFDAKLNQIILSDEQIRLAEEKLDELYFQNYQEQCNKNVYHKYVVKMTAHNIDVKLDCRGLGPGMETLLYKFDPITAQCHPNTKWETLEGFKLNGRIGSFEVNMMKLKRPFMQCSNAQIEGTIILGEIEGKKIPVKTKCYSTEFTIPGTVTDIKLYSDLSAAIGTFEWYFGGPSLKLMDEFADAFVALIPESTLDPSPSLRWWDMLRSIFRGRYTASAANVITHMIAGTTLDEQDNTLIIVTTNVHAQIREGLIKASTINLDAHRCGNGPIVAHLPNFSVEWELEWKSRSDNPHKHLIVPDITRFDEPDYDSYRDFRATEYTWTFSFNFTSDKAMSPLITVDIAHLLYIYDPIKNLYDGSPLNESYKKKVHVQKKERVAELYFFGKVPSTMRLKINKGPLLSLRAFDHFPVKNSAINGTSIDATLVDFGINIFLDMRVLGETIIDAEVKADALQFNATDLRLYSRFSSELSPTFMEIKDLKVTYKDDKIDMGVSSIRFAVNQFNVKYVKEYVEAALHFLPDTSSSSPSKSSSLAVKNMPLKMETNTNDPDFLAQLIMRRSSEKIITAQRAKENRIISQINKSLLDSFNVEIASLNIPFIEILVESLQYDARILCTISSIEMKFNKDDKNDLYCCQLTTDSITAIESSAIDAYNETTKIDEIIKIQGIKFQYYQELNDLVTANHIQASIAFICLNVSAHDIALIKHFAQEIAPPDNKNLKTPKDNSTSNQETVSSSLTFIELSVEQCQGLIKDINKVPIGSLLVTEVNFKSDQKGSITEYTILLQDLKINDIRPGVLVPEVCSRWTSQVEANLHQPIIRFQAKMSPPVGGIPIINHLEINLDPTKVNYEASFFSELIALVLGKVVQRPIFEKMTDCFVKPGVYLPHVQIDKSSIPIIEADTSKYMEETKSKELMLQTDKADEHMMLRYFKITSTKINASYHNAESKIPDINEFNGLFHEIKYQDFNATMETLIARLISDISSDMIPQFLKHMIGLGKIHESEEATLNMWLQNDHDKQSDRQKLMLFGKNKKPNK